MNKQNRGFTLIELLIVIAIIAALSALAFVALNPLARFQDSRNAQRWAAVNALLGAIKLDQVDNGGSYHPNIAAMADNTYYQIGDAATGCDTPACTNYSVDMQPACVEIYDLVSEGYIAEIPIDPNAVGVSEDKVGYALYKYDSGQIMVISCHEELGSNAEIPVIQVAR